MKFIFRNKKKDIENEFWKTEFTPDDIVKLDRIQFPIRIYTGMYKRWKKPKDNFTMVEVGCKPHLNIICI